MYLPALALAAALLAAPAAHAATSADEPISVLFVGNGYTFGRIDPVMSYNTVNVRDLTPDMWLANPDASGNRPYEPHPWGGVAGIFQRLTVQAGLNYDVALSSRNAASLRGHLLNTNPAGWDLRGNIGSQAWDQVVLQEQSDEALNRRPGLGANPEYTQLYVDLIEDWVHDSTHASKEGSYLSALTLFGTLTGLDPAMFGAGELAASKLGIYAGDALALQRIASGQLGFTPAIPEPATAQLAVVGPAVVARRARRV